MHSFCLLPPKKTLCLITYVWQHLRDSSQERLALLEARLTEEQDWRKQLEADLSAAQAALRKDKEVHWSNIMSWEKKKSILNFQDEK